MTLGANSEHFCIIIAVNLDFVKKSLCHGAFPTAGLPFALNLDLTKKSLRHSVVSTARLLHVGTESMDSGNVIVVAVAVIFLELVVVVWASALFTRVYRAVSLQFLYESWGLSMREAGRRPVGLGTGGGQFRGQKLYPLPPLFAFGFQTGGIPTRIGQAGFEFQGEIESVRRKPSSV